MASVNNSQKYGAEQSFEAIGQAFFASICAHQAEKPAAKAKVSTQITTAKDEETEWDGDLDADLYTVLGLGHVSYNATPAQIKAAFRKAVLKYHPDKQTGRAAIEAAAKKNKKTEGSDEEEEEEEEDTDPKFLRVQLAGDTLSDPVRRRGYDSQLDFDESFPTKLKPDQDFFAVFGKIFESNARFSEIKPTPKLGDADTSDKDVLQFYDFWGDFRSWRDFTAKCEHKLKEADSRDEKRWMMQKNKAQERKLKKKEGKRLIKLVETAKMLDPRIRRIKQQAKEAAARKKAAKAEAIRKAQEEKAKAEAERARLKAEAEEKIKQEKEKQKMILKQKKWAKRKARQKLVKLFEEFGLVDGVECSVRNLTRDVEELEIDDAYVTEMCKDMTLATIDALSGAVAAAKSIDPIKAHIRAKFAEEEKAEMKLQAQKKAREDSNRRAALAAKQARAKAREWSADEQALIAKANAKIPGGTRQRWKKIADFVNHNALKQWRDRVAAGEDLPKPVQRTPKECIRYTEQQKTKVIEQRIKKEKKMKNAAKAAAPWTPAQQKQLEAALRANPPSADKKARWLAIARGVDGKSARECVARVKAIRQSLMKK